jgi:hypothetical protein
LSHIVKIQTQIKDAAAVRFTCHRLNLPLPVQGKARLFSGEVEGLAVQLPDWHYPIVADLATGEIKFDNYGGSWGAQQHLDRFLQVYACEKAKIEARRRGHSYTETTMVDGSIKLTIKVEGAQ